MSEGLGVYKAIAKVQAELAKEGIAKNRDNKQQGYKFRGIDDVYNALSGLLADAGLCVLPRFSEPTRTERKTANGGALFCVTIHGEFDFVSADDGSKHTVTVFGEAMDSGDKATNKAMSAAYKYACLQTFCIPTEGDNDADATTHTVSGEQAGGQQAQRQNPSQRPAPQPAQGEVSEFISLVNQAMGLDLDEKASAFVRDQFQRIEQYGDRVRPPTEKQIQWLRKIVGNGKPVDYRGEAERIMSGPPAGHPASMTDDEIMY